MTTAHASTAQVGAVSATTHANNRGRTSPAAPTREWLRKTALRLALASVLVFCLLPIAFLVATSFKTRDEVLSGHFLPLAPTLANWSTVFDIAPLHRNLLNSLAVALVSLAVTLLIAVPATYAVVKLRRGPALAGALLSSYVAPPVVALLPLFFMMRHAGLNNSILGLGLVEGLMNVPVAFWLLRSFFKQVPVALDEAAWLDGVGYWRTLWRVNLPLLWPGLVSTGLICLILTYNEFLLASVLNSRPDIRTITVAISLFQGERVVNFGQMAAASLVGIAPVYLVALAFQKQLVGGLGAGR
ncbi:multiple sugar transport system permease protein [Variovorax boronicumulans]|uniref:carbohydrate ABC transporter permease n=1 Tax=Variovorax boronicumulans TaxID=436515 RepID=UPI002783B765|nr:carbohydrate ABC transporter permease [Variovorax boronicumulans]MDP9993345.1 multiple sugar transport system permease protein [Variovorax boronicumulans]MDQ0004788.1 multiple sugar transport system permease protein [Variovorax boronicumulans]